MIQLTRGGLYGFGFAVVNFAEATIELLLLGQVSLGWVLAYCRWHTLRQVRKDLAKTAVGGTV